MTAPLHAALFHSPIGALAACWSEKGIAGIQLPEEDDAATMRGLVDKRISMRPGEPPAWVREAMARVSAHLAGRAVDLSEIPLDFLDAPAFHRRIWTLARALPAGRTITYGELAALAGAPGAARAVGQAMARNRFPPVVPCHRVVAKGGRPGGFSAGGGLVSKARLLAIEGAELPGA